VWFFEGSDEVGFHISEESQKFCAIVLTVIRIGDLLSPDDVSRPRCFDSTEADGVDNQLVYLGIEYVLFLLHSYRVKRRLF